MSTGSTKSTGERRANVFVSYVIGSAVSLPPKDSSRRLMIHKDVSVQHDHHHGHGRHVTTVKHPKALSEYCARKDCDIVLFGVPRICKSF